jgi:hypothetical protein
MPVIQCQIYVDLENKTRGELTQFQFMNTAVWQLLKVRFLVVNCWFPKNAPYLPPLKVKSVMKPPEPLSIKIPCRLVRKVSVIAEPGT